MIISHKNKFIFVKTIKTAGTSMEIALSKFCGKDDIITPITPQDEEVRKKKGFFGPQNYKFNFYELIKISKKKAIKAKLKNDYPKKFYNHIPAEKIRELIDEYIWKKYFKFTIIRNPLERAISLYYWEMNQNKYKKYKNFGEFLRHRSSYIYHNWEIYTNDGEIMLDSVIKFENLSKDLNKLSNHLELNENLYDTIQSINAKSKIRPRLNKEENSLASRKDKRLIYYLCFNEIDRFYNKSQFLN